MHTEHTDELEVKVYAPKPRTTKKMSVAMADWKMKKAKETVELKRIRKEEQQKKKQEQRIIQNYINVALRSVHGIESVEDALYHMSPSQRRSRLIEIGRRLVEENINK